MTAKEKNKMAGIFLLAHGSLTGLMMVFVLVMIGLISANDPHFPNELSIFFSFFMLIWSLLFVVPQVVGGWKMFKEDPNAKNWGIAASISACLSGALGIGAGVFSLVFLFSDEGKQFYLNGGNQNYLNQPNQFVQNQLFQQFNNQESTPPPPYKWQ